jgi:glycosyltransferase involved in cell wall biosynthesis
LKIIFLINSPFPYYAGGIENWLYNISKKICYENEISILSKDYKPYPLLYSDIPEKIKFYKVRTMLSYNLIKPFIRSYIKVIELFLTSFIMGKLLKKIINENNENEVYYVIALDTMFTVKAGLMAKKNNNNIKLIASSRGPHSEIYSNSFPLCKKLFFSLEKSCLTSVDAIWANGYDTMELLARKGFQSSLMRNGVDFSKFNNDCKKNVTKEVILNENNIKIGAFGTLLPIKGIYELIDAISILNKKGFSNINAYFIGKGYLEIYIKYAKSLKIENKIHFLGHKTDVSKYMKECHIIACLSGGSGMSMATIEAMASKTPIIAWDSPVYQQFNKESKTMLLVKEGDSRSLAEGIIEIIDKYDDYKLIAKNASDKAKSYDWSIIIEEFMKNIELVRNQ